MAQLAGDEKKHAEIQREELRVQYEKHRSKRALARIYNVPPTTMRRWLVGLEIAAAKYSCKCGQNDPAAFHEGRTAECRRCRIDRQRELHLRYREDAIRYKGGKCQRCGYNKCMAALDFHHRDRVTKDPDWKRMRNRPLNEIKSELDKCDLVCRNCHAEIHCPDSCRAGLKFRRMKQIQT